MSFLSLHLQPYPCFRFLFHFFSNSDFSDRLERIWRDSPHHLWSDVLVPISPHRFKLMIQRELKENNSTFIQLGRGQLFYFLSLVRLRKSKKYFLVLGHLFVFVYRYTKKNRCSPYTGRHYWGGQSPDMGQCSGWWGIWGSAHGGPSSSRLMALVALVAIVALVALPHCIARSCLMAVATFCRPDLRPLWPPPAFPLLLLSCSLD